MTPPLTHLLGHCRSYQRKGAGRRGSEERAEVRQRREQGLNPEVTETLVLQPVFLWGELVPLSPQPRLPKPG